MPLCYDLPQTGPLLQGEILGEIWEHVPRYPAIQSQEGQEFPVDSLRHEFVVVMSPGCDLEWDFWVRFPNPASQQQLVTPLNFNARKVSKAVSHVFLAQVHRQGEIKSQASSSHHWTLLVANRDERYHHFGSAPIGNGEGDMMPDLYIDFKKALALPIAKVYEGIGMGEIRRIALIPDRYIHHLMHRYYGFLSRVALPDD